MNPIAFNIFGFDIRYYSLFILFGVIIAYTLIIRETRKFEINDDDVFNLFFWTIIIGIFGARFYYVIFNSQYFASHVDEVFKIWHGGLAIHGGIIFGLLTILVYTKNKKINFLKMLDIVAVPLILAQSIGRWGNFFNSEAYGAATTLTKLQALGIPRFIINGMKINGIYYTPTFFYESLWCFIGFIIMYIFRKLKYTKIGQTTGLYMIWYGTGRFFIESLRTDSLIFMGFKAAQIVSCIMIIIGILLFWSGFQKGKYEDLYSNN